jgi:3-carboxy-cis,cis-muconate cycloisomerase
MISVLDSSMFGGLFRGPDEIAAEFSDRQRVRDLLDVEAALARAEAATGLIPQDAGRAIDSAARTLEVDFARLREGIEASGVPTIELVRQLRHAVGPEIATYVHRGATSQDIIDTAAVLALRRATRLIEQRMKETAGGLADLAEGHRKTVLAGRTHGQHASPITFGLKVAAWLAPLVRHWQRLGNLRPRLFVAQLGGAAGTLSMFDDRAAAVIAAFAAELGLGAAMPWHTQRDSIVEFGSWLAAVTGSLAKMGQDVVLLAQTEIAEVAESNDPSRGGSSTMPHKANPIASEMIVVAARANAALLSALQGAAIQEHERSTHGWQLEWFVVPQMVALTYGAASHASFVASHLQVDTARMRENLCRAGDVSLAESLTFALAGEMGLSEAQALVRETATERSLTPESIVLRVQRVALERGVGRSLDWDRLADPAAHVGAANEFIDRVLVEARQMVH